MQDSQTIKLSSCLGIKCYDLQNPTAGDNTSKKFTNASAVYLTTPKRLRNRDYE